ncbi:hypothetical protein E2562_004749 [Oryza meyeriana var. granulata]|uniref:Uncharacterized protein n=1 Tax=Oryza meyeriana var. granulata TaxID=110450 RepID=A0A6G1DEC6_9ORYZ|nr:hypothetical protein E2562_004749 [Oryza meyeriana var. granulata]
MGEEIKRGSPEGEGGEDRWQGNRSPSRLDGGRRSTVAGEQLIAGGGAAAGAHDGVSHPSLVIVTPAGGGTKFYRWIKRRELIASWYDGVRVRCLHWDA